MKYQMVATAVAVLLIPVGYLVGYNHRSVVERSVSTGPIEAMLREVIKDLDEGGADQARRKLDKLYGLLSAYNRGGGEPPDRFYHEVIRE